MNPEPIFAFILLLTCIYVLWRGGTPERIAMATMLAGYTATLTVISPLSARYVNMEVQVLIVDLAMLGSFMFLACKAERFWTIWLCAMQIIQVLTHFPIIFVPELLPQAYGVVVAIWSLPMVAILVVGTYRHQQRLALYGTDKSWSDF